MNILLVVPEYPPEVVGGGGVVYENLFQQYMLAHQVTIVSATWNRRRWADESVGVPVQRDRIYRHMLMHNPGDQAYLRSVLPLTIPGTIKRIRVLNENHFDVAHLHGYGYLSVDETAWMLHQRKIPYVFTCHGLPVSPQGMGRIGLSSYMMYQNHVASRTVARASKITAISHAASKLPGNREVDVIYNGAAPLPSPRQEDLNWADDIIGSASPEKVVLAAGRIVRSKGFDLLLSALGLVPGLWDKLIILGDDGGERLPLLQQAASLGFERRISFPGRATRSQLSALLPKVKILVVPSRTEPFGLIALEGLMSGLTTIVSDLDGLKEVFNDLPEWRVNPFDTGTFASILRRELLLSQREPALEHRIQLTLRRFSWAQIADQYINVLEAAAESRP